GDPDDHQLLAPGRLLALRVPHLRADQTDPQAAECAREEDRQDGGLEPAGPLERAWSVAAGREAERGTNGPVIAGRHPPELLSAGGDGPVAEIGLARTDRAVEGLIRLCGQPQLLERRY